MDLESIMLRERNQIKTNIYSMILYYIKHWESPSLIYSHRKNSDYLGWESEKGNDWEGAQGNL